MAKKKRIIRRVRSRGKAKSMDSKKLLEGESTIVMRCYKCNRLVLNVTPGTKKVMCHVCTTMLAPPDERLLKPLASSTMKKSRKSRKKKQKIKITFENAEKLVKSQRKKNKIKRKK